MLGTLGWQELLIILVILGLPVLAVALATSSKPSDGTIEGLYDHAELRTATPARRLGGYLLEAILAVVTLGVGWFVWFIIVAPRGQTPAKQLLGMYILRVDGTQAGGSSVWVRELLVKGLLFGIIAAVTFYVVWLVAALWCAWDRNRQTLWDKTARTLVAYSPLGFRPLTSPEALVTSPEALAAGAPARTPRPTSGATAHDAAARLRELRGLLDDRIITRAEYDERRELLVRQL